MQKITKAQDKLRIFIAPPSVVMTNRNVKRQKKWNYKQELEKY